MNQFRKMSDLGTSLNPQNSVRFDGLKTLLAFVIGLFFLWILMELSGLMAQRTGVREAVWMGLGMLVLLSNSSTPVEIPDFLGLVILTTYQINAVLMLNADRSPFFWLIVCMLAIRVITVVCKALTTPFPEFHRESELTRRRSLDSDV